LAEPPEADSILEVYSPLADCSAERCRPADRCAVQLQACWEQVVRLAEPSEAGSILEVYSPLADCSAELCRQAARCAVQPQVDWEQVVRWVEPQEADSAPEVCLPLDERSAAPRQVDWLQVAQLLVDSQDEQPELQACLAGLP
jgi:hypothetical protein